MKTKSNRKFLLLGGLFLSQLVAVAQVFARDWIHRYPNDGNEKLCSDVRKRLNKFASDKRPGQRCPYDVIATYPGFSEPPWEEVDISKNEELLVKLEKYAQIGPEEYFRNASSPDQDKGYRYRAKLFIEQGGRLQVWKTKLTRRYGSDSIQLDKQTVVQMRTSFSAMSNGGSCAGKPKVAWQGSTFIVTDDLVGPDPKVDPSTFGMLQGHTIYLLGSVPVLISSDSISRETEHGIDVYCSFIFVDGKK